jgi:membrane protease YdiL (CAAX protease family)
MAHTSSPPTLPSAASPRPVPSTTPPVPAQHGFLERHPLLVYYVLTFAISWGGMLLVISAGGSTIPATVEQFQRLIPFAIPFMLLGPSVAGIALTGLIDGRAGLRELASRLLKWRVGLGWYAVALLAAPLVFAAVLLPLSLISPVYLPGIVASVDKPAFLLTGLAAALMVGFFEELGWMGFAVPRLRLRYGALTSGLIAGVLWGAWHILGNVLWGGPTAAGGAPYSEELPLSVFMTMSGLALLVGQLPAFRVLMVWVYDRTGSLLVAMLMHASLDAATFILGPLAMSALTSFTYGIAVSAGMWLVVAAVAVANRWHDRSRERRPVQQAPSSS